MSSLENKKNRALKMMLWFGIGSLFMTFAGLTSAFIVSKNREDWVQDFDLPDAFYYSLIFILSSSIILIFARKFLLKNQQKKVSVLLFCTILLGALFIIFQFIMNNQFLIVFVGIFYFYKSCFWSIREVIKPS